MRCISRLYSLPCRVDKHFLHSCDSYDSTTITRGLLLTSQVAKFLSPLNDYIKLKSKDNVANSKIISRIPFVILSYMNCEFQGKSKYDDNPPNLLKQNPEDIWLL